MLFLLDANIPYSAKEIFPKHHKAVHVRDINLTIASDIKWETGRVVLVSPAAKHKDEEQ